MASKFVIPYRQNEKNDANDAEAICEAATRPKTRFVSIKSEEQQAVLCLHRIRQGAMSGVLEDAENALPFIARELLNELWQSIKSLNEEILKYDRKLYALANQMKDAKRLMSIPGIGKITTTAVVATVNDAKHFETSHSFPAWIGLVQGNIVQVVWVG